MKFGNSFSELKDNVLRNLNILFII